MSEESDLPIDGPGFRNAGDANEVEIHTIQSQRRADIAARDLAFILDHPESRRFLMRILELTGIHNLSSTDPILGQRDEGARSVGLEILRIIGSAGIEVFPRLLVEQAAQIEHDRAEVKAAMMKRANGQSEVDA